MYHIKQDQRAQRSAETIYKTVATLMREQSFDTIKVSDIVEHAEIGRSTFYRNFDLIEDVLRWRCDQQFEEFKAYLSVYASSNPIADRLPLIKPMLRFFYLDSTIIELLIASDRTNILQAAFQEWLTQMPQVQFDSIVGVPIEYLSYWPIIRSNAAVGILIHWVKEGKQQAPDALADGLIESVEQLSMRTGGLLA